MQNILAEKIKELPPELYTEVVDFVDFLRTKKSSAAKDSTMLSISEYAKANAGTNTDIDAELESAGIENLLKLNEVKK